MEESDVSDGGPGSGGPLWLHPDDDLAPNRPGEGLHGRLTALGSPGRARTVLARVLGRPDQAGEWRRSLAAEEAVGGELERLTGGGWRVVHSVPLPGGSELSHLLIGPGGVFCVRSLHGRRGTVRVDDTSVRIGRGRQEPYVRTLRHHTRRVAYALGRACGFTVEAQPVLVLFDAARLETGPSLRGLRVLHSRQVAGLARMGGVLKPDGIGSVHAAARDRRTWREV